MNQCEYGSNAYYRLKKWSRLLVTDNVNLDNERVYNRRFHTWLNRRDLKDMLFDSFPVLKQAYELKESYRRMNREYSYEEAAAHYDKISDRFRRCGITQYEEFTNILFTWKEEILNSFLRPYNDRKLSNAYTENINSQLRTYHSVSRGISNFSRFRKRVIYALSPDIRYALTSTLSDCRQNRRKRGSYHKVKD